MLQSPTTEGLENLGRILRHYRKHHRLSLRSAAERSMLVTGESLSFSTISDVERGKVTPTLKTLTSLVAAGYVPYTAQQLMEVACGEPLPEPMPELPLDDAPRPKVLPKNADEAELYLANLSPGDRLEVARRMLDGV